MDKAIVSCQVEWADSITSHRSTLHYITYHHNGWMYLMQLQILHVSIAVMYLPQGAVVSECGQPSND